MHQDKVKLPKVIHPEQCRIEIAFVHPSQYGISVAYQCQRKAKHPGKHRVLDSTTIFDGPMGAGETDFTLEW